MNSFVYLGIANYGPNAVFVKIGKTDHPELRSKKYNTHCPGGLSAMYAAEAPSVPRAFALEYQMLCALRESTAAKCVGGEWFKVEPECLDEVFENFCSIVGDPVTIPIERGRRIANFAQ